jgi:hypothetical protein
MSDLLNNIYLPETKKRDLLNSNSYRVIKDAGQDPTILEGYENETEVNQIEFPVFNTQADKDKFVEENANSTASSAKEYLETFGNFLTEETEDLLTSLQLAAVNGADVAANLMPLAYKMFENAPIAMNMPKEFFSPKTEQEIMNVSKHFSENLGEYRQHLFEKQKDNGWVKDILSLVVQDSAYSIPTYNFLRKAGLPKYPSFFLSAAVGAVGVENEDRDGDKTYFAPFAKDVAKLKELVGILPNTPADQIADEVHQALEYGTFGVAIPGIIDAFKFMKRYIPAMAGTTGASVGLFADNDAEGSPIKAITNAVKNAPIFKSAVVDAAEKLPQTGTGEQIYNTIKNTPGVKESELKWMDLDNYFKNEAKTSFTKQEIIDLINFNKIDVNEVKYSADAPTSLPGYLQRNVDDYETRWRDSELATDTGRPNYDVYNMRTVNYEVPDIEGNPQIDRNVPQDWQSINRNPLINAMDDEAEMVGTGTSWTNVEARLTGWKDLSTGKYTGHVIQLDGKDLKKFEEQTDYYFVADVEPSIRRYIVSSNSLEDIDLKYKYKKIALYEFDPLELERFHLEDEIRNFKLGDAARSNQPVYEKYTEPGGEDYTELVFKIKSKDGDVPAILEEEIGDLPGNKTKISKKDKVDFVGPHFNQENEFAHVRFKTRNLNGMKVLTVDEMQSDLLQASKTNLFQSANYTDSFRGDRTKQTKVLKDFPFKNNWYEFTIKRLTRYAADNGFDAIAIPKGSLAANRYGQSIEKLKRIEVEPFDTNAEILKDIKEGGEFVNRSVEPGFVVQFKNEAGKIFKSKNVIGLPGDTNFFEDMKVVLEKEASSANYSEIQQMIIDAADTQQFQFRELDKVEIDGSGKGKFNLYDKTIPSYMKKYAKKWNAKVYDETITAQENTFFNQMEDGSKVYNGPKIPVTILELSDEMKTGVTSSSQPLFELFGGVSLATWGAQAVSDSMENNIISQKTN